MTVASRGFSRAVAPVPNPPPRVLRAKGSKAGPGPDWTPEERAQLHGTAPPTGTHPLTVSPQLRKVSLAPTLHTEDWVTLLPNSHPWFPSLQGIKPDLHRQAVKALHDPASANFSCLIPTPSPTHTDYKTCLAPPGLWAFAQADPSFNCPSSPLSVQILLKCHLLYEALPKPSNHSGLFAPQRCLSLRAPFGQF